MSKARLLASSQDFQVAPMANKQFLKIFHHVMNGIGGSPQQGRNGIGMGTDIIVASYV